jgi:hypothetical protein
LAFARRSVRRLARAGNPHWEQWLEDWYSLRETPRRNDDLRWWPARRAPDVRLDSGGAVVDRRLFVFGGFSSDDRVLKVVDVFDMKRRRWVARWPMPDGMAQSHLAVCSDGRRYAYAIAGQVGNHCKPATAAGFSLDTHSATWHRLPPLPHARYAPAAQLWHGRLHVLGGSCQDRHTPAIDHWSVAVDAGRAIESSWREEVPIPLGGPHRASAIVDGSLYVIGGQIGDYVAIPGDPDCRCSGAIVKEEPYADVFVLRPGASCWASASPMPVALSHIETAVVVRDADVYIFGGQSSAPDPGGCLVSTVHRYDARADRWTQAGTVPYGVKNAVVGWRDGWVHVVWGQRDKGPGDARPGPLAANVWRARFA